MTRTPAEWDPERYLRYADERGRPFVDLIGRVLAEQPATVVDLGCGPGNLTALLAERWPQAQILGMDSSASMIDRARADLADSGIEFVTGDLRDWVGEIVPGSIDVLVTNATLQWLPDHLELLPSLLATVAPGGWFACQVPGNFSEPSHVLRSELAAEPRYAEHTAGVETPTSADPATYLRILADAGLEPDVWETTYLHVLTGEDPVFTWVSGTGARPTLQALPDDLRGEFEAEFKRRLAQAYPADDQGRVLLPFRRIFLVGRRPEEAR